ncbi:MAG: hypothetical protein JWM86_2022, partial [Thermoleophilia bacterium]|nr:hypothetical protein [Thermoleophilia bacterium]
RRDQIARFGNALQLDGGALQELYGATGAEGAMRLTRNDSWEPKRRGEREVARRIATTGPRSTAITREKRLLAVALRSADLGRANVVAAALPPEDAFTLGVHKRARALLIEHGAEALAPARVHDDPELLAIVAELATIIERDRVGTDDIDTLIATVEELARGVELQYLDRRAGELRTRIGEGEPSDEDLIAWRELRDRRRELDPRAAVDGPAT